MTDTGLDKRLLEEVGGAPTSTRAEQARAMNQGVVTHGGRGGQAPGAPPAPLGMDPEVQRGMEMHEIARFNQSPEGMLTDWNFMRHQQGQGPLSMEQFARLMKASGHVGGLNPQGYQRLRMMLGYGPAQDPGMPQDVQPREELPGALPPDKPWYNPYGWGQ